MLPILYQNHSLVIYSYPLLMGIGWGVAYQVYFSLISENANPFKNNILFWGIFLSAWIGAKSLFLITQPQNSFLISQVSFWTGGGFVFYGGLIGGAFFCLLYHWAVSKLTLNDIWPMIPALALGHGIGRIGCFLAGCCFGKETDLWWGVLQHGVYRHPTQILESLFLIGMGIYFIKSKAEKKILLIEYLYFYGFARLGIEALRGDEIRGLWGPLSPSQWLSLAMIIVAAILHLRSLKSVR